MPYARTVKALNSVHVLTGSKGMASAHNCHRDASCININGGYDCECNDGFVGNGFHCTNVNECDANVCQTNTDCTDTIGSYECSCVDGYNETDDGRCVDIDECIDASVCHENASCMNTEGSYYCSCEAGFIENGVRCEDADECSNETSCGLYETCFNT